MSCDIADCGKTAVTRGWCNMHYKRWLAHGNPHTVKFEMLRGRVGCEVTDCDEAHYSKGYCVKHYQRWRKHGDAEFEQPSPTERFWSKVLIGDGCWEWTDAPDAGGYGRLGIGTDTLVYAHRFAYELMVGPIPDGLEIDHLCWNRLCVNPTHLDPKTKADHARRSSDKRWNGKVSQ